MTALSTNLTDLQFDKTTNYGPKFLISNHEAINTSSNSFMIQQYTKDGKRKTFAQIYLVAKKLRTLNNHLLWILYCLKTFPLQPRY